MSLAESTTVHSVDPRTDRPVAVVGTQTSAAQVDDIVTLAAAAAPALNGLGRASRAGMLRAVADALEAARVDIVRTADVETALGATRLGGELTRTVYQARLFADVVDEGSYLEAIVDHAGDTPMGPGPDLRRMLVPVGPVAVFGSSNFPLAFSVPGGDTVSALAAGNPVVLKAHPSHPATSALCFDLMRRAVAATGAPAGTLGIVYGQAAGRALVAHPGIRAVGFTGSLDTAKKLLAVVDGRDEPIPFYGELSSLNPVVVTERAAAARSAQLAAGLAASVTASGGQLCTKPGVVFVPTGAIGDALVSALVAEIARTGTSVLLNDRIRSAYLDRMSGSDDPGLDIAATGAPADGGRGVPARLWTVGTDDFTAAHAQECFGPAAVVVRYAGRDELLAGLSRVPSSLTGTIHHEPDEVAEIAGVVAHFQAHAGRIIFNQYPTGVLVAWAQTHGGPWPATNTLHTSVGCTAIRRFLRPMTWQNAPAELVPEELHDSYRSIPRRVDGVLTVPA